MSLSHALPSAEDLTLEQRLAQHFRDVPPCDEADPLAGVWLEGDSLAPYVVTPLENILRGLSLAQVRPADTLLDVGCGDGRVVVAAAAVCGCRARGVELDARVAAVAEANVQAWHPVTGDRASVTCGDATLPGVLDGATVLFCSLLPEGIAALLPALQHARRHGARLVTLHFPLPDEQPVGRDELHRLFLYPALKPG